MSNFYSEGKATEHPDVAGQSEFQKKADVELERRRRERVKRRMEKGPQLPSFIGKIKEEKNVHGEVEVPSGKIEKITKKAVKRIDSDVDGDVENNDKKKGNYGEFFPSPTGKGRLYTKVEGFDITKQSSKRKSLGRKSSIKSGSKPTGYESPKEFRDAEIKFASEEFIIEKELTKQEMKKREEIVKSMKKKLKDFEKRYPGRGEEVMYATATKLAKEEIVYENAITALVEFNFAEDYESADNMFENLSDTFILTLIEEYIEEKARGTRPKRSVHAYDVDETLFGHGKKGKPNVQVHVKDDSGKRVQSLSNQEFNTHKLKPGHKYDFGEFQSAKKFRETSSPNKKVIKDIKRKQARGQNVHLVTARSKFDNPSEFQGHLKKHGVNVDKSNIHYTGGMKGGDVGQKKVKVVDAVAKKAGAKKAHMYDDAAKVHKGFEAAKKDKPTSMDYKTHMVAPDKSGESRVRSYQATKGGSTGGPKKTTKEKQRARKKARKSMGEEMTPYEYWKNFIK